MKGSVLKTILVLLLIAVVVFFGLKLVKYFTKREGFEDVKNNSDDTDTKTGKLNKAGCKKLSPRAKAAAAAAEANAIAEKAEKEEKAKEIADITSKILDNEKSNEDDMEPTEQNLLNITCASGDLPKISFFRNSRLAMPTSRDVNTLNDVTGSKEDIDSSEPSNQYAINANSDDVTPSYKN